MDIFEEKIPRYKVLVIKNKAYAIDIHSLMHKTLEIESGHGTINVKANKVATGPAQINVSQIDSILKNKKLVKETENLFGVKINKNTILTDTRANILAGYIVYLSKMRDVPHWVFLVDKKDKLSDFTVWKAYYNGVGNDGKKTTKDLKNMWIKKNKLEYI